MPDLYLIEPDETSAWFPFADSRPICELRAGAWLIRQRWEGIAGDAVRAIFAPPHLQSFVEDGARQAARDEIPGPAIVGLSTFAPTGIEPEIGNEPLRFANDGTTVGWWVPEGETWSNEETGGNWQEVELEGLVLHGAYDIVTALEYLLHGDVMELTREPGDAIPDGSIVIGDPGDVVILGAMVEPGVTFDVREGAVVLEQHSYVRGGTRFEGPVFVGPGTQVLGGQIQWSSIGPVCKVRGEMTHTVFLGYGNKAHDGFVGHSVLGRWANLGADTVTSNLKNTYGTVRLDVPGGHRIETERQLFGSCIGDHAKTAIGTLLQTGTLVGAGANVFGEPRPPKLIPPFAWGTGGDMMHKEGFLSVAERVMPRRKVEFDDGVRQMLEDIYDHAVTAE